MRVIWIFTAIAYAILFINMREMKFKHSGNTTYVDNDLAKVGLTFTTLEYGSRSGGKCLKSYEGGYI